MKDLFAYSDYRSLFRHLIENSPQGGRGAQTRLASQIGCQQAFLSRILKGQADLSGEQAIGVASYFGLTRLEREFLLCLVAENRAGNPALRAYYQDKLEAIREERRSIHKRITEGNPINEAEKAYYYGDWYFQALHMVLGLPGKHSIDQLAKRLDLSPSLVEEALQILVRTGLATQEGREFKISDGRIHLPPSHPLVRRHHVNWRLHSIQRMGNPQQDDLHYTSVVTCSRADRDKIKAILSDAISQIRELVKASKDEVACHYALDIYNL